MKRAISTLFLMALFATTANAKIKPPVQITVNTGSQTVKSVAVRDLTSSGYVISSEGQFQIVFVKDMTGAAGFMSSLLLSPSACQDIKPHLYLTLSFVDTSNGTTVTISAQIEHAGALCRDVRENVDDNKTRANVNGILERIKDEAEITPSLPESLKQQAAANSEAEKSSPAAAAALAHMGHTPTPQEMAQLIRDGQASRCGVITTPPGAEVFVDGNKAGISPMALVMFKRDTPRVVTIKLDGYKTVEKQFVPDGKDIPIAIELEKSY